MADFRMPSLGADMDEGTVLEWLVHPGDAVHKGDIVAVVDTAKAAVEVETFVDGVISELLVEEGTKVPVGTPLARIDGGGMPEAAATPTPPARSATTGTQRMPGRRSAPAPVESTVVQPRPEHPATPLVRTLAAELGVDLGTVTGTGARGRVTRKDVQRAAAARRGAPESAQPATARPEPATVPRGAPPPATAPRGAAPPAAVAAPAAAPPVRRPATPYARRLAHELGVGLAALDVEGVVDADDVRRAAEQAVADAAAHAAAPPASEVVAPTRPTPSAGPATEPGARRPASPSGPTPDRMREAIARLMARSKREIPHYYLSTTVDLGRARAWMQKRNRDLPVSERLVPAALLLKATALATRRHPQLNGFWVDDAFVPGTGVHLGVAISLRGGGLVAPAIHDADTLTVAQMMAAVRDLVGRARAGRLRGSEMSDPTLTVTNLGDQGVESVQGVIYPPQVALVGFGRVVDRPWAVDGMLAVRPVVSLTLAADHRATDGFSGSRLLATIDQLLQTPEEL